MTRLKPAVEVLPANDEYNDRGAAKVAGSVIKHLWDLNNVDYLMQQMHRHSKIFGESFAFTLWDKSLGDFHPAWQTAVENEIPEIELNGEIVEIDPNKPIMTGDVCYEHEVPWRVLLQRKNNFKDCDYVFRISIEPTEDLKKDHPKHEKKIKTQEELRVFDIEDLTHKYVEGHCLVFHFWHRHTKYLPKGKYIKFTNEVILEQSDLPFTHGKLPIVRLTDQDVPDVLNGVSRYETVGPIQKMYDNISTLIAKNIYLTAHAKWMMPRGACKLEQLGNDNTIVQYQGPVAPQLAQVAPNPSEVYAFREKLKEDMQTIYGSHGISRGEVPKGITAASALQFLNELENERSSSDIAKHSFMVKDLAKMTLAVAGDYYDAEDGRLVRIVGQGNKFFIKSFDVANLNKNYDIRIDNSTGLPESKAAKIQRLMDIMQRNPQLFSPERWEELLDLGNIDRAVTMATEALRSADSENEDLMAGNPVMPPEEWEDHVAHWESHVKAMQSRSYKEEASNEVVAAFNAHLKLTEELMIDKAKMSPLFQAELSRLKLFPIFFHENFTPPLSREQQEALAQGQANRGEAVTGNIPGDNKEDNNE